MLRASSHRSQKGIGLIETVIAALLLGITVSGSIFIAAELSRSGVNARVRAGALDVSTSSIEAALYAGAGVSDLSSFNTTQGAVSNATYNFSTNSSAISSTTDWTFRGGDQQVALSNAHFYDSELIGNVASGGSGDLVAQNDSDGDSGSGSGSESGGDGGSGDDSGSGSDSLDSGGSGESQSDSGGEGNGGDGGESVSSNWTGTIIVTVDQGSGLDQDLSASLTPSSGYDSGSCTEAGDDFTCSINVLTGTTWAGQLTIDVDGSGNDVICDGDEDSGDDPWQETLGLTQASPSATVTVRHEDRSSRCDTDEAPSVNDSAITISTSVSNGSASPSQQLAFLGQTATIAITPNTGYEIASNGISGCNGTASSTSPYTTGTLTEDCTVSAVLSAIEYLVSAVGGTNGTVSPSSQNVAYGGSTSFTVTPDVSHALTGVGSTSDCSAAVSGNDIVVSSVTGACTVTPTYTIKSYDMTAIAGSGIDSVNPASQSVEHGDTGQVSVTVATGYENPVASGCGDGAVSAGAFTSNALTSDCSVTISASKINYTVTAVGGSNGSISPTTAEVPYNEGTTFTVTPDTSHTLTGVGTVGDCSAAVSGNDIVVSSVTGACTVTPTYTIKSYTMTATAGAGIDSVTPASQSVEHGQTGQVSVTLATGYENPVASGCGDGAVSGGQFTSGPLTADCEVTFSASGEVNTVSWNASNSSGVGTPSGLPTDVTYPSTFTVPAISALEGYSNVTIYSNCETGSAAEVSSGDALTVSSNCEIYATAEEGTPGWTAQISVSVTEKANNSGDHWDISVPGCAPSSGSYDQPGNSTFTCSKESTAESEAFTVTIDGMSSSAGICTGKDTWNQDWSASITLSADSPSYSVDLVLEHPNADTCGSSEAPIGNILLFDFENDEQGWDGSGVSESNGVLRVGVNKKNERAAEQEFDYGSDYAGDSVQITMDLTTGGGWDVSGSYADYARVRVKGDGSWSTVYGWSSAASATISFQAVIGSDGKLDIRLESDTTANSEYAAFDNIEIRVLSD